MTPHVRKLTITTHVAFSVGWLGATAAFLALSIAGLTSHDAEVVRGACLSMNLISRFVIIPMSFAALATGLLQALGTPWGLFRYYWILVKFGLAILATSALLIHQFAVMGEVARRVSGAAAEALFSPDLPSLLKLNSCALQASPSYFCSRPQHWECTSRGASPATAGISNRNGAKRSHNLRMRLPSD